LGVKGDCELNNLIICVFLRIVFTIVSTMHLINLINSHPRAIRWRCSIMKNTNMKWDEQLEERRKEIRHYPGIKNQPIVNFSLNSGTKIPVDTLNISQGGLMGYTSGIEHFSGKEDLNIQLIEIIFPNKEPFCCFGRILRLQHIITENRCYCAVQFNNGESVINKTTRDSSVRQGIQNEPKKRGIPDWKLLQRVSNLENYRQIEDCDKEIKTRRTAYNTFDDITEKLTIEERWWFYEILDEMKLVEPEYPDRLKKAFLNLCHTGIGIQQSLIKQP